MSAAMRAAKLVFPAPLPRRDTTRPFGSIPLTNIATAVVLLHATPRANKSGSPRPSWPASLGHIQTYLYCLLEESVFYNEQPRQGGPLLSFGKPACLPHLRRKTTGDAVRVGCPRRVRIAGTGRSTKMIPCYMRQKALQEYKTIANACISICPCRNDIGPVSQ